MTEMLFKTDDATVLVAPAVHPYKSRFVLQRTTDAGDEWYNASQKKWYPTKQIHGPHFMNPKASYFRSEETATAVLQQLTIND